MNLSWIRRFGLGFVVVTAIIALVGFSACARSLATGPLKAGISAARADDWDEALRHWTEAVRQDPGSAAAHNNLAVAHEKHGAWEEARREYEEALRLEPENRTIKLNYDAFKARLEAGRGARS